MNISLIDFINSTESDYKMSKETFVFISILYGIISFISVFGNLLIIYVVVKNKSMHNVTNYFISNLAMADIVIGMFSTPFQVYILIFSKFEKFSRPTKQK